MNKKRVTTKIHESTLNKLRELSQLKGQWQTHILEQLIDNELKRVQAQEAKCLNSAKQ